MNYRNSKKYKLNSVCRKEELKSFTRQYGEWKKELEELSFLSSPGTGAFSSNGSIADPTSSIADRYSELMSKIRMVERCCREADPEIADALLIGVTTKGSSVEWLQAKGLLHCERDKYYIAYAKYFWLLDKIKN